MNNKKTRQLYQIFYLIIKLNIQQLPKNKSCIFYNFKSIIIAVIVFQQDKKKRIYKYFIKLFLMKYLIKVLINLILLFTINQ